MVALDVADPIPWARWEAAHELSRGLDLAPRFVAFDGGDPVVYLRCCSQAPSRGEQQQSVAAAVAFAASLEPDHLLAVFPVRLSDPDAPDELTRDVTATFAVGVERVAFSRDETPTCEVGTLLHYRVGDDGCITWDEDTLMDPPGLVMSLFGEVVTTHRHDPDLTPAAWAYVLSRMGIVVAVAASRRSGLGFEEVPDPAKLRPEDRARARQLRRRPHRSAGART